MKTNPKVSDAQISAVMAALGSRRKRMTPAALRQRKAAALRSAKLRRRSPGQAAAAAAGLAQLNRKKKI